MILHARAGKRNDSFEFYTTRTSNGQQQICRKQNNKTHHIKASNSVKFHHYKQVPFNRNTYSIVHQKHLQTNFAMDPSPVGTEIGTGRLKFRVGTKIGTGACASIYELKDREGNPTEFAIKIAPISKKSTKSKKETPEQANARLLYSENNAYRSWLCGIQGKYIPRVPLDTETEPPAYGDENGESSLKLKFISQS